MSAPNERTAICRWCGAGIPCVIRQHSYTFNNPVTGETTLLNGLKYFECRETKYHTIASRFEVGKTEPTPYVTFCGIVPPASEELPLF